MPAPKKLAAVAGFRPMHRQVLLLVVAQAFFQTASTIVITIGALVGARVPPNPQLATAPIAAMFLGTVLATLPASHFMARFGRKKGFVAGALLGALGGLASAWGVHAGSLLVLSAGTLFIGAYNAFAQFYRFAASEVADEQFRPRAVSWVLAGSVVAAILGPALATLGGPLFEPAHVGSFLILSAVSFMAACLLLGFGEPALPSESDQGQARPLLEVMRQPTYAVALFAAASGSGVMVLAMTATPLAMNHHGHGFSETAFVIQAHVLGMFAPSFFTGAWIARFGVLRIMTLGGMLLGGHVILSLAGSGFASFGSALVLLGVGWNFLYIGGTTLLTSTYRPAERARAQAANDLIVYVVGLAASLLAGALLQSLGWRWMNISLLPWILMALLALRWLGKAPPPAPRSPD
jgi:MFS family permease